MVIIIYNKEQTKLISNRLKPNNNNNMNFLSVNPHIGTQTPSFQINSHHQQS